MTAVGDQHRQVAELLGVFALDAVDAQERELVEQHLEQCRRCQLEVDQLREVGAAIGSSSEPPPEALWGRIAAELGERAGDVPAAAETERVGRRVVAGAGARAGVAELPPPATRGPDRPDGDGRPVGKPSLLRRGTARSRWAVAGIGAAAACAAIAAVFGVNWSNADGRVSQLQRTLARQGDGAAVQAALESPGRRVVELRSTTGTQLAALVVRRNGNGYFLWAQMQALPRDETYQLWAEIADQPISLGLLGSKPGLGDAFSLGSAVGEARELMVTVEPSGGVVTPDSAPVATANLT